MSRHDGALERGRTLMETQGTFTPADAAVLLAAGLADGFNPRESTIDGRIERFLVGTHGRRWRAVEAEADFFTPAERAALEAAERDVADKRAIWEAALDERWTAEALYYHPTKEPTPEQVVASWRRHDLAVKAQVAAQEALAQTVAVVTDLKLRAQARRRDAAAFASRAHK
jgi:hypothetical protein